MNDHRTALVAEALGSPVRSVQALSGGCVSEVCRVESEAGSRLVAKFGPFAVLEEERAGLQTLAEAKAVRVPQVTCLHGAEEAAVLLMEELVVGSDPDWGRFGRDLALLHSTTVGERYGFDLDNHLGTTPQPNGWMDDWVAFNRTRRHGPLVDALVVRGALTGDDLELVRRVLASLGGVLPERPRPSLLHGDLWSGNAIPLEGGGVAVIDPAPYVGHALADIAMMQLFGGFPPACFEGYLDAGGEGFDPACLAVYRLHHLLNHLLLFGPGYLSGVRGECRLILDAC